MQKLIEKMRADWVVVSEDRRACGEWTEQDVVEIGDAVKLAIDGKKPDLVTCWARWLADLASTTVALKAISLGIDARMKEAARKHRETKKGTGNE